MIYFIIVTVIIVGDKFLKEYFRSSLRGKHRKEHFTRSGEEINTVDAMQDGWKRKIMYMRSIWELLQEAPVHFQNIWRQKQKFRQYMSRYQG